MYNCAYAPDLLKPAQTCDIQIKPNQRPDSDFHKIKSILLWYAYVKSNIYIESGQN